MEPSTILGTLGLVTNATWPLFKIRRHILIGQIFACIFMMLHFVLLGAETGAVIMLVAGLQATLAIPLEKNNKFKDIYIFSMLLVPLISWYTWHGLASVFSSAALLLFCFGNLQSKLVNMRVLLLLCIVAWVGHNILMGSIPGLLSNFLAMSTSLYALYNLQASNKSLQSDP